MTALTNNPTIRTAKARPGWRKQLSQVLGLRNHLELVRRDEREHVEQWIFLRESETPNTWRYDVRSSTSTHSTGWVAR